MASSQEVAAAKRSYLLCATPRTGSYLLADLLRQTGAAGNPTEYLSSGFQQYWTPRWGTATYQEYLAKVREVASTPNGVCGVKAHPRQLRHFARQATGIEEPGTFAQRRALGVWLPSMQFVWMRRRDQLRQAVSWAKSMQTNVWWDAPVAPAPFDEPRAEALRFDVDHLTAALIRMRREDRMWQRFFDDNEIRPLTVWYEDLVSDRASAFRQVVDFLGVSGADTGVVPSSSFRRQSDGTSERWVRRYRAAAHARFEGTFSACAGMDADATDVLVLDRGVSRPAGWDESRHSLIGSTGCAGSFRPDYVLGAAAPDLHGPVRFVEAPGTGGRTRDIVLPNQWLATVPPVDGLDRARAVSAALAAHLGADRVGIEVDGRPGGHGDTGACRVVFLDDTADGLDVDGFLAMPPRAEHERGGGHALAIAILVTGRPPGWAVSLRHCIAALTRHSCAIVDATADAAGHLAQADVVLGSDSHDDRIDVVIEAGDHAALTLVTPGQSHVVAEPLDWWRRPLRPRPASERPIISVPSRATALADRLTAHLGDDATVSIDLDTDLDTDTGKRVAITVVEELVPTRRAVRALARGSVLVRESAFSRAGKSNPSHTGPAPVVSSDDLVETVGKLLADPEGLAERGRGSRAWIQQQWDFSDQWDTVWAPVLHAVAR